MDTLKHPGTILGAVDLVGLITACAYFQRQVTDLKKAVEELKTAQPDDNKTQFEEIGKHFSGVEQFVNGLAGQLGQVKGLVNALAEKTVTLESNQKRIISRLDNLENPRGAYNRGRHSPVRHRQREKPSRHQQRDFSPINRPREKTPPRRRPREKSPSSKPREKSPSSKPRVFSPSSKPREKTPPRRHHEESQRHESVPVQEESESGSSDDEDTDIVARMARQRAQEKKKGA